MVGPVQRLGEFFAQGKARDELRVCLREEGAECGEVGAAVPSPPTPRSVCPVPFTLGAACARHHTHATTVIVLARGGKEIEPLTADSDTVPRFEGVPHRRVPRLGTLNLALQPRRCALHRPQRTLRDGCRAPPLRHEDREGGQRGLGARGESVYVPGRLPLRLVGHALLPLLKRDTRGQ